MQWHAEVSIGFHLSYLNDLTRSDRKRLLFGCFKKDRSYLSVSINVLLAQFLHFLPLYLGLDYTHRFYRNQHSTSYLMLFLLKSLSQYYSFIFMSQFLLIGKHYSLNIMILLVKNVMYFTAEYSLLSKSLVKIL